MTFNEVKDLLHSSGHRFKGCEEEDRISFKVGHLHVEVNPRNGFFQVHGEDYRSRNMNELRSLIKESFIFRSEIERKYNSLHWILRLFAKPYYESLLKEVRSNGGYREFKNKLSLLEFKGYETITTGMSYDIEVVLEGESVTLDTQTDTWKTTRYYGKQYEGFCEFLDYIKTRRESK